MLESLVQLETQDCGRIDIVPQQKHQPGRKCRQIALDHGGVAQTGVDLRLLTCNAMIDRVPAYTLDSPRRRLCRAQMLFVDHWPFSATASVCSPTVSRLVRTLANPAELSSARNCSG